MTTLSFTVPVPGSTLNSIADPEIATALTSTLAWANGDIDGTNLSAAAAQSGGMNQSAQTVKGAVNIPTSQSTSSTTFTTLSTPDQITGIVLPTNGLIVIGYMATWQNSVGNAGNAAIFIGANQLQYIATGTATAPLVQAAQGNGNTGIATPLGTSANGLTSGLQSSNFTGNVTTGQILTAAGGGVGGPCYIFAAAGTYTVSVQFKASSGSVTVANRQLWAWARSVA